MLRPSWKQWMIVSASFVVLILLATPSSAVADMSYATLLDRMTDLRWLAHVPADGERGAQFSSYDRATQMPFGIKLDWFANDDAGHFLDTKVINGRREAVLADVKGPGAIVRLWTANPQGTLRIYLDDSTVPAVEMPFADAVQGTGHFPFAEPFSGTRAGGGSVYFPFSFQNFALVTVENPGKLYYHVNYATFAPDTEVETYSPQLLADYAEQIQRTADRLVDPHATLSPVNSDKEAVTWSLAAGESRTVQLVGPAAITELVFRVDADELNEALRETLLTITWDDMETAGVWSPIGDLFGGAPGLNPYYSLPLGVLDDGTMYSRWYMPFARSAVVEIANEGNQTVHVTGSVSHEPITWHDELAYFHAKWRQDPHLINERDWMILSANGPGRYVGMMLSVMNPTREWWGEGDEKIYVDREQFPSTFGTGTADYFGYAGTVTDMFTHAYHNQSRADGPDNMGHIINSRFHMLDNIPFQNHIRFDLEILHRSGSTALANAAVAYWYSKSNVDAFITVPVERRNLPQAPELPSTGHVVEGESMVVLGVAGGQVEAQHMGFFTRPDNKWSEDGQLWWHRGMIGDKLRLSFPVEEDGMYQLSAVFTNARDYGIVQLYVDGAKLGGPVDLFGHDVTPSEEIGLGSMFLQAGEAELTVEIVDANPAALDFMFGLDYIRLSPAVLEGESLPIIDLTGGITEAQEMSFFTRPDNKWSQDRHLWWRDGDVGDSITLAVPVASDGKYRITGVFTKARDYATVQFSIDGHALGGPVDFFDPNVVPTEEIELGEAVLNKGEARFTAQIVGANPNAVGYMFGVDYIKLIPVD